LIVFNLHCVGEHRFEGWFGSSEDYESQRARGLLECPVCGSGEVRKALSAPRLNFGSRPDESAPQPSAAANVAVIDPASRRLVELVRRLIAETDDVGHGFAEEARRIHYKEVPARSIRGVATQEEAKSLQEEGIEVAHLPLPAIEKSRLN
jgi:hypothetical protein